MAKQILKLGCWLKIPHSLGDRRPFFCNVKDKNVKEEFCLELECDKCGCIKIRIDYNDSLFCLECNEWKEEKCQDPDCSFSKSVAKNHSQKRELYG